MKSTELLSILVLLGCAEAKRVQRYPGVRFMAELQDEGAEIDSLAEAESERPQPRFESELDEEDYPRTIHTPQSLTEQQVEEYTNHIAELKNDPDQVYGESQPWGVFNTRNNVPMMSLANDDDARPEQQEIYNVGIESDMQLDERQTIQYL